MKQGWILRRSNGTHHGFSEYVESKIGKREEGVMPYHGLEYDEVCSCGKEYFVPHLMWIPDGEGEKRIIEIIREMKAEDNLALVEYKEHQASYIKRSAGNESWREGICFFLPCGCKIKMGKAGVAAPYRFIDSRAEQSAYKAALALVKDI